MRNFLRDEAKNRIVDVEEFEIDGRDSVLAGKDGRNRVVGHEAELYEVKAQPPAMLPLIIEGLTEMLGADQILADENFAEFC